jgi:hypothetical protein
MHKPAALPLILSIAFGTWRPPQPKVDTSGEKRLQRAKLLGDLQRRVVRKHDPTRPDADRRGACRYVAQSNRSGRACDIPASNDAQPSRTGKGLASQRVLQAPVRCRAPQSRRIPR